MRSVVIRITCAKTFRYRSRVHEPMQTVVTAFNFEHPGYAAQIVFRCLNDRSVRRIAQRTGNVLQSKCFVGLLEASGEPISVLLKGWILRHDWTPFCATLCESSTKSTSKEVLECTRCPTGIRGQFLCSRKVIPARLPKSRPSGWK